MYFFLFLCRTGRLNFYSGPNGTIGSIVKKKLEGQWVFKIKRDKGSPRRMSRLLWHNQRVSQRGNSRRVWELMLGKWSEQVGTHNLRRAEWHLSVSQDLAWALPGKLGKAHMQCPETGSMGPSSPAIGGLVQGGCRAVLSFYFGFSSPKRLWSIYDLAISVALMFSIAFCHIIYYREFSTGYWIVQHD